MKNILNLYLKVRSFYFSKHLYLYLIYPVLIAMIALPGAKSQISIMANQALQLIPDFIDWVFQGQMSAQKDLFFIFFVTLPSLIVITWRFAEWITGFNYLLKRKGLI